MAKLRYEIDVISLVGAGVWKTLRKCCRVDANNFRPGNKIIIFAVINEIFDKNILLSTVNSFS